MRRLLIVIAFVFASVAVAAHIEPGQIEVIDGDTISVGNVVYRLVGFDTPEVGLHSRCERERTLGNAATQRLRQLVSRGALDLTRVRCACHIGIEGTRRCNYGRLCAVLTARGKDVGVILVNENLARPYICGPTSCPRRESWCH